MAKQRSNATERQENRRIELIGRGWPTHAEILRIAELAIEDPARRDVLMRSTNSLIRGWSERHSDYVYPDFQWLGGYVHPQLEELLSTLASNYGFTPSDDPDCWKRIAWLHRPQRELSVGILMNVKDPELGIAGILAKASFAGRSPADVFWEIPDRVIDFAKREGKRR